MKTLVTLSPHDIQAIVAAHIRAKFEKAFVTHTTEYLSISMPKMPEPIDVVLEVARRPLDPRG